MATSLHDVPGTHVVATSIPAHDAGDSTVSHVIFRAPFAAAVEKVVIIADADITGADTNTFHLNLINRGTDGTGTTELANRDYTNGTDESDHVARDLYSPSDALAVDEGVVLDLQRELVGTGQASPRFYIEVHYRGN